MCKEAVSMNEYNTYTLANGLRVIHLQQQSEVVYCGYAVKAGARNEALTEEGLAHFCEHLAFKGTTRLSSMQIINSLERVGGELNAYTAKEETVYYSSILKQYFNRAVETLTEMVFHSTYPQEEIEKDREVICDEIDCYKDSPAELIYDEFEEVMFRNHPLGHNVLGTKENVRRFDTNDCLRFTRRHYVPENTVFFVLGDVNFSSLIKRLEKLLCDFPIENLREVSSTSLLDGRVGESKNGLLCPEKALMCDDSQQTHQGHVMTGLAFCNGIERWRIPLFIVNNILGGPSMNSRLNLTLREKRGLVYTVEGIMTPYSDALLWSVYFGCDKTDIKRCLTLVKSQIERFRKYRMSETSLRAAKTQLYGQIALSAQQKENFAIDMVKQYLHYGTLRNIQRLKERIEGVTTEDIYSLANNILNRDNLFTLIYK